MKRLFLLLMAGLTGWFGYRKLRSDPRTADKVADLEHQSQRLVNQAGDAVRSATDQAAGKAADVAGKAADAVGKVADAVSKPTEAADAAAAEHPAKP